VTARFLFVPPLLVAAAAAIGSTGGEATSGLGQAFAPCGPHHFVADRGRPPDAIEAYFTRRSYAPGEFARLNVIRARDRTTVRIFRAFAGRPPSRRPNVMTGMSVGVPLAVRGSRVEIRIGTWKSGLYFARLVSRGGVGYAPFIVRAAVAGANDVAIVLPTNTWEAYNFLDQDRNGFGDTWYADPRVDTVRFDRPFLNRGVPPHLGSFPYWVWLYGKHADYLADDDLDAASSADALARLYRLIIFAGHEEYATSREFDVMSRYRDLGGNLAFLSANNFYARGRARRRAVPRLEPRRIPQPTLRGHRCPESTMVVPRDPPRQRLALRILVWRRNRHASALVTARHRRPRGVAEHLRPGQDGEDDLLHGA